MADILTWDEFRQRLGLVPTDPSLNMQSTESANTYENCANTVRSEEKHGRLVDENVILERIQALLKEKSWMYASHAQEIIDIIRNAPTVVEASR